MSNIKEQPVLTKSNRVIGKTLIFKDACLDDAQFILSLRTDANKSKYLSKTSPELQAQVEWLNKYSQDDTQVYFIIQDMNQKRVGTVRLYDQKGDSFCWGSWIIIDGSPSSYAIESALMVYHYAISLGFRNAHFDVRKGNESVWRFHERFGAVKRANPERIFFIASHMLQSKSQWKNIQGIYRMVFQYHKLSLRDATAALPLVFSKYPATRFRCRI